MTTTTIDNGSSTSSQRKTLASQLDRLDSILDALDIGLKEAVATAVQGAVEQAVREAVTQAVTQAVQGLIAEVLSNPDALALVRATSDNGMAVTAACRQLELMRQTVAEETGGSALRTPGLQIVIIERATGRIERTISPPAPMIEHDALDGAELEP